MKYTKSGFTIVEILVATTLFAFTSVALTSLFNYTLRINRKAEALRQATQGARDFVELIAKEVRNGQIDYGVINGQTIESQNGPCPLPTSAPSIGGSSYAIPDNRLGVTDVDGSRWCFYWADTNGTYVGQGNSGTTLAVTKMVGNTQSSAQIMNPPNQTIKNLSFLIQPICDPYVTSCNDYGSAPPKVQPSVTLMVDFTVKLPTGEVVDIPYQTSISTDKYDVPNAP